MHNVKASPQQRPSSKEMGHKTALPLIAGIDEAGRGAWAGEVVAAAVILHPERPIAGIKDSKKLTPLKRIQLATEIQARALAWSIGSASAEEIDALNVLEATLLAMWRAVQALPMKPDQLRVDGRDLPPGDIPAQAIIGGDDSDVAIGAASILAKVTRDQAMLHLHQQCPEYHFDQHKGYGTAQHRQALLEYGICEHHRRSYKPVRAILELDLV